MTIVLFVGKLLERWLTRPLRKAMLLRVVGFDEPQRQSAIDSGSAETSNTVAAPARPSIAFSSFLPQ
jgi:hypothetical protein